MVRLLTSAEYLPPLPEELPPEIFERLEAVAGVKFPLELRRVIDEAAYLLVDGMRCHETQPNASEVSKRLTRLISVLEKGSSTASDKLIEQISELLDQDPVGEEVLGPLLTPPYPSDRHLCTLSTPALEERRLSWLASARALEGRFRSTYAGRRGANADLCKDLFIQRLAEVAPMAGLRPSFAYSDETKDRQTPFVQLVIAVANAALRTFAPEILSPETEQDPEKRADLERLRDSFVDALESRIRIALHPRARHLRAANSRRHAAKKRAKPG
jgi:hypothetical protein